MRRTFPQKVKPSPSCMNEHEETMAQARQAIPETNRRVRTSAAMIGLAISMGAYGLPISRQGDGAVAAEPIQNEPVTSASSASFEAAALSPDSEAIESSISRSDRKASHTVQEGQTLWDVARFYGTDVSLVALANSVSVNAVLQVGQVLIVPTDNRLAQISGNSASTISPGYYGPISGQAQGSESQADLTDSDDLKNKQHKALKNLKQKTQSLQSGLTSLSSKKYQAIPKSAQQVPQVEQQSQVVSTLPAEVEVDQVPTLKPLVPSESRQQVAFRSPVNTQLPMSAAQGSKASSYRIAAGDTLAAIARIHNISVKQLADANRIPNPNYIFANQTLIIPPSQSSAVEQSEYQGSIASVPIASTVASASSTTSLPNPTVTSARSPVAGVQVAATSFSGKSQAEPTSESESRLVRYNHVENLRQEIDQLRQRYQTQALRPQTSSVLKPEVAASSSTGGNYAPILSDRVNPEFSADRSATLRTQLREMRSRVKGDPSNEMKASPQQMVPIQSRRQVVAAAPLGSESYDPLLQSKIGKAVSPELPSLGTSESYLPGGSERLEGFIWPAKGVLTSGFGWRWGRMHKGVDIAGPTGTPVVAAAEGVVVTAGWNSGGYGYLVEIRHPDGSLTLYAHNNRVLVQAGQQVTQGQQISEMGSTGYSTGPHLHFEVHPSGKGAVNPMAYLPRG